MSNSNQPSRRAQLEALYRELRTLAFDHAFAELGMGEADAGRYADAVRKAYMQARSGGFSHTSRSIEEYLKVAEELGFVARCEGSIHLQQVGEHTAITAANLRVGDVLVWNGGSTSTIIELERETKAFRFFKTQTSDGRTWSRKLKKSRLVAFIEEV